MQWAGPIVLCAFMQLASNGNASANLVLSLRDGRVSIVAHGVTVREVLAEWARVGQVKVVNLEAVPAERVTIELEDASEEQALTVLLRKASGYIAAPRASQVARASRFDRLLIMPPSIARARVEAAPQAVAEDLTEGAGGDQAATEVPVAAPATQAPSPGAEASPRDGAPAARAGTYHSAAIAPAGAEDPSEPNQIGRGLTELGAVRQMPVSRPMASGQMAGRRRAEAGAATGPRDVRAFRTQQAADHAVAVAADVSVAQESVFPDDVPLPPQDPAAQESFRGRRPLETVDPRKFRFPTQPAPGSAVRPPGGPGRQGESPASPDKSR